MSSPWQSYRALTRRQRIGVGLFGIVSALVGMWFTDSTLDAADRERRPLGMLTHEPAAGEKRPIVRMAPRKSGDSDAVK